MINRRTFLAYSGGTALTLFLVGGNGIPQAVGQVAGGSLDPAGVPQFLTPLLVPPVMPTHGRLTAKGGRNADYYEISMRQFRQQILPDGLPQTTVWGYGPARAPRRGTAVHHAPSLTIEAKWETPVRIKWVNDLVADDGPYLPHLLPVHPPLHPSLLHISGPPRTYLISVAVLCLTKNNTRQQCSSHTPRLES